MLLALSGPSSRVFVDPRLPSAQSRTLGILSWALALLQSLPKRRAAASMSLGYPSYAAPPLRFLPLQRLPARRSGLPGLPLPGLTSPGSLNLLTPKRRPMPAGPIQTRSALGVCPSEPCSSRAAVRRLQRPCPHVVGFPRPTSPLNPVAEACAPRQHRISEANPRALAFRALLHARVRSPRPTV